MAVSVTYSHNDKQMNVVMSGVLTFENQSTYTPILDELKSPLEMIAMDFAEVERLDSTAIGFLFDLAHTAKKLNIKITAHVSAEAIKRKFELTKLDTVIDIYD